MDALIDFILFDEGDDEEEDDDLFGDNDEEANDVVINVDAWRRMGDTTFKSHFRMDRWLFEILVVVVGRHMTETGRIIRRGMNIDLLSLMMALWVLATTDTFRSTGIKFGVAKGSVHNQYRTIIAVLRELSVKFIRWPTLVERETISRNFEDKYGFPGVCGCIDGTHIRMTAPLEQAQRYINRHHDYSVLVQATCDDRLLFRDVFVGQPGSVGDARMFERSPLGMHLLRRRDITGDLHILGDGAYTLTAKLLTPYRDNGNLTQRQRTHNYHLSQCRSSIERAFALLKGKWRRLKHFPNYCIQYANDHIMACLVLHNFVILEGEVFEEREDDEGDIVPADVTDEELLAVSREEGSVKRDYIAALLFPEN